LDSASELHFEWDHRKAYQNRRKHGVSFTEAASVFGDPLSATVPDLEHSSVEERWLTTGLSEQGRILRVCHTWRGKAIRIITARPATREEQKQYETNGS